MAAILVGMGAAAVMGGVMSGISGSAAQDAANQAAIQQYQSQELQKGQQNGREMFQAAYQWQQQVKRNQNIRESAYLNKEEALRYVEETSGKEQSNLSVALRQQNAALKNNMGARGISNRSGMANAIGTISSLSALKAAGSIASNLAMAKQNIEKQTNAAMSGQTENTIIGNYSATGQPPLLGSTTMPLISGIVGGLTSGVSSVGGAYYARHG